MNLARTDLAGSCQRTGHSLGIRMPGTSAMIEISDTEWTLVEDLFALPGVRASRPATRDATWWMRSCSSPGLAASGGHVFRTGSPCGRRLEMPASRASLGRNPRDRAVGEQRYAGHWTHAWTSDRWGDIVAILRPVWPMADTGAERTRDFDDRRTSPSPTASPVGISRTCIRVSIPESPRKRLPSCAPSSTCSIATWTRTTRAGRRHRCPRSGWPPLPPGDPGTRTNGGPAGCT